MEKYDQLRGEEYVNDWPRHSAQDLRRREATILAAKLCMNAALTAPVAGGVPQVEAHLVYGQEELEKVARKMEELAYTNERWKQRFLNEAVMVRESDVILFLGNYRAHETPLDANCGLCGGAQGCSFLYTRRKTKDGLIDITDRRSETPIQGPLCGARVDDLGYAWASAAWMAQTLLVDARPFMSVGLAGMKLGYCPNSAIVVGMPMATLSKNPYQDINIDYHLVNMDKMIDNTRKNFVCNRQTASGINFDYRTQYPKKKEE
ncbi:MAG: hypothetical protein HY788_15940 [Deltaproteobacteria bacterium]|nr:hypothetical protein [Deltaproteobacteria bacterium]